MVTYIDKYKQNMSVFRIIPALALLMALAFTSDANPIADHFTKKEIKKIERFVGDVMACSGIPGLTVGVVRGQAAFDAGFGITDIETGSPVNGRTIFNLGSTSKAFVPYVLAELMNSNVNHDGRLRWNMTLKQLLQNELDLNVTAAWANQQLKDALVYRASPTDQDANDIGLDTAADMSTMAGLPKSVTREEIIRRAALFMPESPEFKTSGHYSNLMYTIAAHLAERVAGKNWTELVWTLVLEKQKMDKSQFSPEGMDATKFNVALPYKITGEQDFLAQNESLFDFHPFEPIGALMASADDITNWLGHLLDNLYMKGENSEINMLIGDAFVNSITSPKADKPNPLHGLRHDSELMLGHGMGWQVSHYRGRRRYQYSGRLYGYTSHIWLYPEARTAVFVATNGHVTTSVDETGSKSFGASLTLDAILYLISDVAHRDKPWVKTNDVCELIGMEEDDYDYNYDYNDDDGLAHSMRDVDYKSPLDAFEGSYGNGLIGDMRVEANEDGVLILTLGRNLKGELSPGEGSTPRKLKLKTNGFLKHTDEWAEEKIVEFFGADHLGQFGVARLILTDALHYDFVRDEQFEKMLLGAEHEAAKEMREAKEREQQEEQQRQLRKAKEEKLREEEALRAREEMLKKHKEEQEKQAKEAAEKEKKAEEERRRKTEEDRKIAEESLRAEQEAEEEKQKQEPGEKLPSEEKSEAAMPVAEKEAEEEKLGAEEKAEPVGLVAEKEAEEEKLGAEEKSEPVGLVAEKEADEEKRRSELEAEVMAKEKAEEKQKAKEEEELREPGEGVELSSDRTVAVSYEDKQAETTPSLGSGTEIPIKGKGIDGDLGGNHQSHQPYEVSEKNDISVGEINKEELPSEKRESPDSRGMSEPRRAEDETAGGGGGGAGSSSMTNTLLLVMSSIFTIIYALYW